MKTEARGGCCFIPDHDPYPVMLYTIQKPDHDLTKSHKPLDIYLDPNGPYFPIAEYLRWKQWSWCFHSLTYFFTNNDWLDFKSLLHHTLWTLLVPYENIVWCSLDGQCEDFHNIKRHIYPDSWSISIKGEIPMALVRTPIKKEWVVSKETARDGFRRARLI